MTIETWDDLDFWRSGEWQVIEERLDALDQAGTTYCPERELMFSALDATPYASTRVCIVGQDPYPDPKFATGMAFSIPKSLRKFPPTLANILQEYCTDLHYDYPKNGSLEKWCEQGVLLWNCIPSCEAWKSMSHDWTEWSYLTKEIVQRLSEKGIVFCFLGSVAQRYTQYVGDDNARIFLASHPSRLGARSGRNPFLGSRPYSSINSALKQGHIDWRL
jgi:uracil-DNA glycosylase